MLTFKNIVLATDLSENSAAAAPYAVELARIYNGTIHVLYVSDDILYQSGSFADGSMGYDPETWMAVMREHWERLLREFAEKIRVHENIRVNPVLVHGYAPEEIVKFATEQRADCIVIATHGRTGLAHFFNGSVAEKVIRTSPCPVLTIRPATIIPHKDEDTDAVAASAIEKNEDIIL